jgi:hypothetical protein
VAAVLLVAMLAAANAWVTLDRSTITRAFEGTIERLEVRSEKHAGVDDVHLLHLDGERILHVDAAVAERLRVGDHVSKRAWSSELRTSRGTVRVPTSRDFRRMVLLMPLFVLATIGLAIAGRRREAES